MIVKKETEKQKKIGIKVRVTPDQLDMIHERMRAAHTENREAYIRKMALDGFILELDSAPLKEMCRLLRSISNNLNQVAKQANSSGRVYETDLFDMAQKLNRIWDAQNQLLSQFARLK